MAKGASVRATNFMGPSHLLRLMMRGMLSVTLTLVAVGLLILPSVQADSPSEEGIISIDTRGLLLIDDQNINFLIEEIREIAGGFLNSYLCLQFHPSPSLDIVIPTIESGSGEVYINYMIPGIGKNADGKASTGYWELTYNSNGPTSVCIEDGDSP